MNNYILIIDFGSQYTQNLTKCIRALNVYSATEQPSLPLDELKKNPPKGVIFSGGPKSVQDPDSPTIADNILSFIRENKIPLLGVCYGMQLIATIDGGTTERNIYSQFGNTTFEITEPENPIFKGVPKKSTVWMSHFDSVTELGPGFRPLGFAEECPIAASHNPDLNTWTLLFHPEVDNSEYGSKILGNFLFEICKAEPDWIPQNNIPEIVENIRATVGKSKVLAAVSGGKDSTVAAALVHAALGDSLYALFIDNGLLRHAEAERSLTRMRKEIPGIQLEVFDASELFLSRLEGRKTSREIRVIIGQAYIDAFQLYVKQHPVLANEKDVFLMQGTIYSDYIESGRSSSNSVTIQLHHNVGTLPKDLGFKLLEPIKFFFKDEVALLGRKLGLTDDILKRHPFPGPSLSVRVFGNINARTVHAVREATRILEEELIASGLYNTVSQAAVILLTDISPNSVKGDSATYKNMTAVIRAVNTKDFMTCSWSRLPHDFLAKVSTRITNEVENISRVVYDITDKPPATVEWQ